MWFTFHMRPAISVIIPVYNHAKALRRSLLSLAGQSERSFEVIVVDDGSTDDLSEAIKNVGLDLKIIRQENKGAPAARNRGLEEAAGEYIIFWDADTVARSFMLEKFKKTLIDNRGASYAYSQFRFGWKKIRSQKFKIEDLRLNNYIDTTSLVRREALVGIPGPFDESLKRFQDWDLWLTLLEKNKTGIFIPEVLYKKCVQGRKGISMWLPRFAYRLMWRSRVVQEYAAAKNLVLAKHHLSLVSIFSR